MKTEIEKIHIHKVAQMQNCSYDKIYSKYGRFIDENKMIPTSVIN